MIIPLLEGTHYDDKAIKNLINAGWDEDLATDLIKSLFEHTNGHEPLIHAFVHSGVNWLEKYLVGIARMYDEQTGGNVDKVEEFKEESTPIFDQFLMWVRENRDKLGGATYDAEFNQKMSYQDVKNKLDEIQSDLKKKNDEEMSKLKFGSSNYKLIPIESYQQMHKLFGGNKTGDGTDEEGQYAGNNGTAWCHTNNEGTYNDWVHNGKNKFYVLQRNNYENIPFDADEIKQKHGYGEYADSLMAILADKYGNLKKVTLRGNHVGDPSRPDNMYETYAELSKIAGFNVEQEVAKYSEEPRPEDEFFIFDSDWEEMLIGVKKPMEKMVIPDFVEVIGEGAFENEMMIKEIVLPQGLKTIGRIAFAHCTSLEKINFPDTINKIEEGAFLGCIELQEARINSDINPYTFEDCYSLKKVEIGNGCYSINSSAFSNCLNLEEIVIPTSVSTIGTKAFAGCALTKLNVPTTVSYIGEKAFNKCLSLKEVNIEGFCSFGDEVFSQCKNLEKVHLSDTIDSIPFGMFHECKNLKEINIPKSCEMIGGNAFFRCSELNNIDFPDKLFSIGDNAFKGTPLLQDNKDFDIINDIEIQYNGIDADVVIPEGVVELKGSLFENNSIETVTLPESLRIIGQDCFNACGRLRKINFPEELERIESNAFRSCKSLKEVVLPNTVKLGAYVFVQSGLEHIKLPSELLSVPYGCFSNCYNLKQIDIPDGVRSIEGYAFSVSGLESINIPSSVEIIRNNAFEDCDELKTVTLNEGLLVIPKFCFGFCKELTSITIPESVAEIEDYAFIECSELSSVTIKGDDTEISSNAFDRTPYYKKQQEQISNRFDDFLTSELSKLRRPLKHSAKERYNRNKLDL